MPKRSPPNDLFGKPVKQRRPRYEAALERADKATLSDRAARVRWLSKIIPKNLMFGLPLETFIVLNDAKSSFVYGNFISVVVLASAFIEHWFASSLAARGYAKEASRGLAASIEIARKENLVASMILEKVDRLRLIRNPIIHLKPFDYEHGIGQRSLMKGNHFGEVLEEDAKEAITTLFLVAAYAFSKE